MKDPYIQENGVLTNRLGITDYKDLNKAEKDIGFVKLIDIGETFKQQYNAEYLKSIHKHIFEDIFDWAGEFRTVPVYKTEVVIPGISLEYSAPKNIEKDLNVVLAELNDVNWSGKNIDEITAKFTGELAKIWRVHPFRDGNTRTTLAFAENYSREHGFPMDIGILLDHLTRLVTPKGDIVRYSIRDKFVLAALDEKDYPEPEHLQALIKQSILVGIKKEKEKQAKLLDIENGQDVSAENSSEKDGPER